MSSTVYCFGIYRIDPARRQIAAQDGFIELPSSAFDCLVYLIQHRERAVGRDELISAVWGRADISENLLSHTLVRIRRALADSSGPYGLVRTVARFGYHWIAPIRIEAVDAEGAPLAAALPTTAPAPAEIETTAATDERAPASLAVLATPPEPAAAAAIEPPLALAPPQPAVADLSAAEAPPRHTTWRIRLAQLAASPRVQLAAGVPLLLIAALLVAGASRFSAGSGHSRSAHAVGETTPLSVVLPAHVDDAVNADWMRLGVMEAVSSRLRSAQLAVVDSADVLLLQRDGSDDATVERASRRIEPTVRREARGWRVELVSHDGTRELHASGVAADAIAAARAAADNLSEAFGATRPLVLAAADDGAPALGVDCHPLAAAP